MPEKEGCTANRYTADILQSFGFGVTEIRGEDYDLKIKPIVGPGDYDSDILYLCEHSLNGKIFAKKLKSKELKTLVTGKVNNL